MPIYKIQAGRIITVEADQWVGDDGVIWYDGGTGEFRYGDGTTPGGRRIGGTIIQSDTAPYATRDTIWYDTVSQLLHIHDTNNWIPVGGGGGGIGGGVTIFGSVSTSTDLIVGFTGSVGSGYIVRQTGNLWVWDGTTWIDVGEVQGPRGYTGSRGIIGYTGSSGYSGSQGELGYVGSQGYSTIILGSVNAYTDLPGYPTAYTGQSGDSYITKDTGVLWSWYQDRWNQVGNIIGYAGSQGFSGARVRGDAVWHAVP
jgi:hypothetical protein